MLNQKTRSAKGSRVRALILLAVILVLFNIGLVYAGSKTVQEACNELHGIITEIEGT